MQIDPDIDLLIFKIRKERMNISNAKEITHKTPHRITFNLIDGDIKNIEKPIASELEGIYKKITRHKKKEENINNAKKVIQQSPHKTTFNLIDGDIKNIEKPIASELEGIYKKITEHERKVKKLETVKPQPTIGFISTENELNVKQKAQEKIQSVGLEKTEQLQNMQNKIDNVLEIMEKINKRQKIISENLE